MYGVLYCISKNHCDWIANQNMTYHHVIVFPMVISYIGNFDVSHSYKFIQFSYVKTHTVDWQFLADQMAANQLAS